MAVLLLPPDAYALCSCEVDPVRAAEMGAYVIRGEVQRVQFLEPLLDTNEPPIIVGLDVIDAWTEIGSTTLRLHTIYNRHSCEGYWFGENRRYLLVVFPNHDDRPPSGEWPPRDTLGVMYCGVWEEDDWGAMLRRLDSKFTRISG